MNDAERLEQIKKRLEHGAYVVHPMTDVDVRDDMGFLLNQISQQEEKIKELDRKVKMVVQQNLELTVAMEDVRADFERRNDR